MDLIFLLVGVVLVLALLIRYKFKTVGIVGLPRASLLKHMKNPPGIVEEIVHLSLSQKKNIVILDSPFNSIAVVTHPDVACEMLKNDDAFPKSQGLASVLGSLLHDSLALVNGSDWRHQRSTMSPAFHYDYLKGMIPLLQSKTEELLSEFPKGVAFDAKKYLYHFTVDVLGLAAFGVDFKTMTEGEQNEYYKAYQDVMTNERKTMINILPTWLRNKLPLADVKKARVAKETLTSMTTSILEGRKGAAEKSYLVDMMLEAQPPFTAEQLRGNMLLFFLAGHETTAAALNWALYLLAEHPDKQTRVREELDRVLGGKHIESDDFKELTYLDMFIKEMLRFASPIAFLGSRTSAEDAFLDGHFLPKNTIIGLGIHAIHHHPDFWKSPEVFDPERFAPNQDVKQHPYAFLPFSLAKRNCIGNTFSLIEQKLFLCMLLQRYIVERDDNISYTPFVLDPKSLIARVPLNVNIVLKKR